MSSLCIMTSFEHQRRPSDPSSVDTDDNSYLSFASGCSSATDVSIHNPGDFAQSATSFEHEHAIPSVSLGKTRPASFVLNPLANNFQPGTNAFSPQIAGSVHPKSFKSDPEAPEIGSITCKLNAKAAEFLPTRRADLNAKAREFVPGFLSYSTELPESLDEKAENCLNMANTEVDLAYAAPGMDFAYHEASRPEQDDHADASFSQSCETSYQAYDALAQRHSTTQPEIPKGEDVAAQKPSAAYVPLIIDGSNHSTSRINNPGSNDVAHHDARIESKPEEHHGSHYDSESYHVHDCHHYSFYGQPVYQKSSTNPAHSFFVINSSSKPFGCWNDTISDGRMLREYITLKEARELVDPVGLDGPMPHLGMSANLMIEDVTGRVTKLYGHGRWAEDHYDLEDDRITRDPMTPDGYDILQITPLNGFFPVQNVPLSDDHQIESDQLFDKHLSALRSSQEARKAARARGPSARCQDITEHILNAPEEPAQPTRRVPYDETPTLPSDWSSAFNLDHLLGQGATDLDEGDGIGNSSIVPHISRASESADNEENNNPLLEAEAVDIVEEDQYIYGASEETADQPSPSEELHEQLAEEAGLAPSIPAIRAALEHTVSLYHDDHDTAYVEPAHSMTIIGTALENQVVLYGGGDVTHGDDTIYQVEPEHETRNISTSDCEDDYSVSLIHEQEAEEDQPDDGNISDSAEQDNVSNETLQQSTMEEILPGLDILRASCGAVPEESVARTQAEPVPPIVTSIDRDHLSPCDPFAALPTRRPPSPTPSAASSSSIEFILDDPMPDRNSENSLLKRPQSLTPRRMRYGPFGEVYDQYSDDEAADELSVLSDITEELSSYPLNEDIGLDELSGLNKKLSTCSVSVDATEFVGRPSFGSDRAEISDGQQAALSLSNNASATSIYISPSTTPSTYTFPPIPDISTDEELYYLSQPSTWQFIEADDTEQSNHESLNEVIELDHDRILNNKDIDSDNAQDSDIDNLLPQPVVVRRPIASSYSAGGIGDCVPVTTVIPAIWRSLTPIKGLTPAPDTGVGSAAAATGANDEPSELIDEDPTVTILSFEDPDAQPLNLSFSIDASAAGPAEFDLESGSEDKEVIEHAAAETDAEDDARTLEDAGEHLPTPPSIPSLWQTLFHGRPLTYLPSWPLKNLTSPTIQPPPKTSSIFNLHLFSRWFFFSPSLSSSSSSLSSSSSSPASSSPEPAAEPDSETSSSSTLSTTTTTRTTTLNTKTIADDEMSDRV